MNPDEKKAPIKPQEIVHMTPEEEEKFAQEVMMGKINPIPGKVNNQGVFIPKSEEKNPPKK